MNRTSFRFMFVFGIFGMCLGLSDAWANNLALSNFNVDQENTIENTMTFSFDLAQNNSWRNAVNYDAIWIFMKYSTDGGVTWLPASMAGNGTNPSSFLAPAGFEMVVPSDETGLFFERTSLGSGNISVSGVKVVWDYGQDGLSDQTALAANTITKIFGIEMVYIPEGAFFAGDGNSSSAYRFKQGSADNDPWYIQNENALSTASGASDGYYYQSTGGNGENNSGDVFLLSNSFPKGYRSFYLMKYEMSEGQWVAFFNTLPTDAKRTRDITGSDLGGKNSDGVVNRNTIAWDSGHPVTQATTTRPDRAMTYLSWPDLLAYADWSCLRPITELEFEKSARGKGVNAVVNEFVWGNTSYNTAEAGEISPNNDEDGSEVISDTAANINRNNLAWSSGDGRAGGAAEAQKGALRAGIFSRNGSSRATSGAGYYGNMDLSGNVAEQVVTIGRQEGRNFLGTHGDGRLSTLANYAGNATNADWPGIDNMDANRGVTGSIGSGYRGGDFNAASTNIYQTSDRTYAAKDPDSENFFQRYESGQGIFHSGRLGRSAP